MLLVIAFIILSYLGVKIFKLLKYLHINNKRSKNTILQANPGPILGLLFISRDTSASSMFHVKKEYSLRLEIKGLNLVLQKLDREQPHPSGISRLATFQEYIHELEIKRCFSEY